MTTQVSIFPIRHHGPGSARSLEHALNQLQPDIILVEGPADADAVLPFLTREELEPPVALLGYVTDDPARAAFWPFAAFSPEFVAFRWAAQSRQTGAGAQARFMDLPASATLALRDEDEGELDAAGSDAAEPDAAQGEGRPDMPDAPDMDAELRADPLRVLAQAAGYSDFERWWETLVEARGNDFVVFEAILEAMQAVRVGAPAPLGREAMREAFMRQTIRAALKEGFQRVAVVCGAWHSPALDTEAFKAKEDAAILKGLPKAKVSLTWVPWTHGRLSMSSGYGAGVRSPGYYHHLFTTPQHVTERWFARAARLLRDEKLDASSASVIEATRLANTLAALRGRALPGLDELNEAALSVFGWDSDLPLRLISQKLIVGEALGKVPDDTPSVPLAQDLARQQKKLRLKVQAEQDDLTLDLRKDTDLERSALFHRLNLLGVPWAQERYASGKGTFKEAWVLVWKPEFSVRLVEASRYGQTVEQAATAHSVDAAHNATTLSELTALLEAIRHADLTAAVPPALNALNARAALNADVGDLLGALPPLARLARYGDVRGREASGDEQAAGTFRTLLTRASVGLPTAAIGLAEDAANELRQQVQQADAAVRLLDDPAALREWQAALRHLADRADTAPVLVGDAVRRLRDAAHLEREDVERRLSLALSSAAPLDVTAWLDGFLGHSGTLLIHDAPLLNLLDGWLSGLEQSTFQEVLPLLRRVFSRFEKAERRAIGENLKGGGAKPRGVVTEIDEERGLQVVPIVLKMLGVNA
ncbi:hypothetical protein D3875_15640 [Deinococcus cavernae]|uniref:Uncharacterized protein n=1 Tax=Deinococcus cavernae TaxID=2320857 RepID=A0A418V9M6_9DEIO|nr:DUF5682 family protein [Deinococcus cavernae]RJF72762.1 hypothetical protein D3875_15640 [Deinococcus cavernae]